MDALIAELREAIARYDWWPQSELLTTTSSVINCARDVVAAYDAKIRLDRQYTEAELRASPYTEVVRDAVVVGPDEYRSGCQHYYADPSGGFGWPSCVKCGASVPIEESYQLRACCQTRTTERHASACTSIDAWEHRRAERE